MPPPYRRARCSSGTPFNVAVALLLWSAFSFSVAVQKRFNAAIQNDPPTTMCWWYAKANSFAKFYWNTMRNDSGCFVSVERSSQSEVSNPSITGFCAPCSWFRVWRRGSTCCSLTHVHEDLSSYIPKKNLKRKTIQTNLIRSHSLFDVTATVITAMETRSEA